MFWVRAAGRLTHMLSALIIEMRIFSLKIILVEIIVIAGISFACSVPLDISPSEYVLPESADPLETYLNLRSHILETNPNDVGIKSTEEIPNVWGVLMEFWISENTVTLACLADGTTSLYFSNGGGIIGSGEIEEVAEAAKIFVAAAEKYIIMMDSTNEFPLPDKEKMQFYVLTYSDAYRNDEDEDKLISGDDEFSPLFFAASEVITQVRLSTSDD